MFAILKYHLLYVDDLLEEWLIMLKEKGEKETFKYIKKVKGYKNENI